MLALLLTVLMVQEGDDLTHYVHRAEPDYRFQKLGSEFLLTSQRWQSILWKHRVSISVPRRSAHTKVMVLLVTGDDAGRVDTLYSQAIADASGMAVATVFQVPNQPLFSEKEDGLIALSFQRYLETGDSTWPLLLPMTKTVVKAMDGLEKQFGVKKFIVTGASKRGWTTWLSAATGDPRIAGIAPMVFDNLNFIEQLKHQRELWGHLSPMLADYSGRDLPEVVSSEEGRKLVDLVDPFSYLDKIKVPTLIINGSNDPYWAVDALSKYWYSLRQPKSLLVSPNKGHNLGDTEVATLGAFARSVAGEYQWPTFSNGTYQVPKGLNLIDKYTWSARSTDFDFTKEKWSHHPVTGRGTASFTEYVFAAKGLKFRLSGPVKLQR